MNKNDKEVKSENDKVETNLYLETEKQRLIHEDDQYHLSNVDYAPVLSRLTKYSRGDK